MKPVISVISILLSLGTAQAATIFSTTNINAASSAGNNYFGFATQLTSPVMSTTTGGEEATLPETVYLNSLSLDMRSGSGSGTTFKVAIYTFTADGTVGDLVGLSSNANAWADGATLTFDFNNVELNSTATYQYLFVSEDTTWENLNLTAGTENMTAYRNHAVSASLSMSNNNVNLPSGTGTYKNNTLNSWEGRYLPAVNFSTSNEVIPEPATATLGLLGMGALLLRRRR
ncbi:PEP-CTERM sorting domain-containing protein [Akkermansia sp.]|uniref:PEP-CTERM sorting domain-containing protein n=1 Tax=Akkermansia sp. TaxID=1872421 RepID=UPI0025BBE4EB|nr:PEP-CTERM sorting domain-containing protein [Akkermansia sp.]MCD8271498.1 PEP-CTERM sorting domain-containing protein [Akkermansia sp.]